MKQFQHIIDKINGILSEEFEVDMDEIVPLDNLRLVLNLDSLDYVDLAVLIENNFSFKVQPADFMSIVTFSDLYEYIISHIQFSTS